MIMSLRGAILYFATKQSPTRRGDCFVGKSTLLATTWGEMKSLDEESAEILKAIKGLL